MLIFGLTYCSIGALVTVVALLRTPYDNEPDVMVKLMARKDYSNALVLYANILIKFIVPLILYLVIVFAWPALLLFQALDMWRVRGRHHPAKAELVWMAVTRKASSQ